jgi:hypothetical protein
LNLAAAIGHHEQQQVARFTFAAAICNGRFSRPVSANSGHSQTVRRTGQVDPEPTFEVGLMNGRDARESGLRLKTSVTYSAPNLFNSHTLVSCRRQ